jgi:hypothetical protein
MWKWLTGMGTGNTLIDRFWFQCCEDGEVTGRSPVLVLKANNRQSLVICSSGCVLYMIAYERWKAQAMQNGLDRKLALPLGYSKGLSAEALDRGRRRFMRALDRMFIGAGHDQQIKLEAFQGLPIEADLKPSHPLAVVQSAKLHQSIRRAQASRYAWGLDGCRRTRRRRHPYRIVRRPRKRKHRRPGRLLPGHGLCRQQMGSETNQGREST